MWIRAIGIAILVGLFVSIPRTAAFAAQLQAQTENGVVEGVTELATGVTAFKGIPFATPPVGDLRWRAPLPAQKWDGVRKADRYGAPCVQNIIRALPGTSEIEMDERTRLPAPPSEDCLSLNVWTAAKSPGERRPVMVWIHGGGLTAGTPAAPRSDGAALAAKGVVLVSMNYRLGIFGFFAHPELTRESDHQASGNYGFLDQLAALHWVKNNIRAFGGDPDNVTVFGESAGSWSVNVLVASPLSKGLFHRAIGQSGGFLTGMRSLLPTQMVPLSEGEQIGVKLAQNAGVQSIRALRAKSAAEIMKATEANLAEIRFGAVLDGWVLPDSPERIFARGEQNDVPTLIGSNDDEGAAFARQPTTADAWRGQASKMFGDQATEFLKLYPGATDSEAEKSSRTFFGDGTFAVQMRSWARAQARTGKAPVYLYWFDRVSPDAGCRCATHASEIPYVFNTVPTSRRPFQDADRMLADTMSSYWVNFAKGGNPNGPGLPQWPAYSQSTDRVFMLGDRIEPRVSPHKTALDFIESFFAKHE
jgi:para-nitrobenzyl esterase